MAAVVFSERGRPRRAVTSSANPVLPFAMAQFSSPVVSPQPDRGLDLAQIGTWPKMTWSENGVDLLAVSASLKLLLVVGRAFARPGDLANLLPVETEQVFSQRAAIGVRRAIASRGAIRSQNAPQTEPYRLRGGYKSVLTKGSG